MPFSNSRRQLLVLSVVLIGLPQLILSADDPWAGDVDTVVLDADNFTSFISNTKLVMLELYTPWCGHCRSFAPEYARAATELKKDGIILAKVSLDDPKNHPLAQQFGVQGFPTIRIFKKMYDSQPPLGTTENFDTQPRTYDAVVNHLRALGLPPKQFETNEQFEELKAAHLKYSPTEVSVLVVGLFADGESKAAVAFREAKFGRTMPTYAWTKDRSILVNAGFIPADHTGDAVVVVTPFKDDPKGQFHVLPSASLEDIDAIVRFVDIYSGPLVWRYAGELTNQITSGKLQRFLWAFVNRSTDHLPQYEAAMNAVAAQHRTEIKFVIVGEDQQGLYDFFKIDTKSLPQLLFIDLHPEVGQRQFKYGDWDPKKMEWNTKKARKVDAAKLLEFIADYNAGRLKRYLRSEPRPQGEEAEGNVVKVVGNTFEDTIRSGKDVLLEFYGDFSWCEHCKVYAPEWELIGKFFKPVGSLVVAKMDFHNNDIEDARKRGIQPSGFPEVYMFRAGEHELPPIKFDPEKYNGERGLNAITQFVKDYAVHSFTDNKGTKFGGRRRDEL